MAEKVQELDPDRGRGFFERLMPGLETLREVRFATLAADAGAAAVIAVLLLPQSMAYALLAELPPQVGLYAAVGAPLAYMLFGSSRFLSLGPVALVSLIAGETLATTAAASGVEPVRLALALAALVGALLVVGGLVGLGQLADILAKPVLMGFTAGAAVLIASSQLRHFFGLDVERAGDLLARLRTLVGHLGELDLTTTILGAACLAALVLVPLVLGKLGGEEGTWARVRGVLVRLVPLAVLATATALTFYYRLGQDGVDTVGEIPVGTPPVGLPPLALDLYLALLPGATTIAIVTFATGYAVASALAARDERIPPAREMVALGASNLAASLTGGYPVGASVSRSSVLHDGGARTPIAAALGGALALGVAIVAAPAFLYLPKAALAALILSAAFGLFDVAGMRRMLRYRGHDGAVLVVTFAAVLLLGVDLGLLVGVGSALASHLWHSGRPRVVVLGEKDDDGRYHSAERDGVDELETRPVLTMRPDEGLFFANARYVRERIVDELLEQGDGVEYLLLDLSAADDVDSTALDMLTGLKEELAAVGVGLALAELKAPVYERLERIGFLDEIEQGCVFTHVEGALDDLKARCPRPAA